MEDAIPSSAVPTEIKSTPKVSQPDPNALKIVNRKAEKPQTLTKQLEEKKQDELKHTEQRVDLPPEKDAAIAGSHATVRAETSLSEMPVHDPKPAAEPTLSSEDPSDDIIAQATPVIVPIVGVNKQEVELPKELIELGVEHGVDSSKPRVEIVQQAGILERSETASLPFGETTRVKLPFSYALGEQVGKRAKIRDSVKWLASEVLKQWARFSPETVQTHVAGKKGVSKIVTILVIAGVVLVFLGIIGIALDKYQNQ